MSLQLSELDKISNYGQTGEDQALHLERQFVPKKDDRDRLDMNKYLKGKFKHFILMLKDAIEYLILQPRLELLKYFRMLHQHSIKSKFLTVTFSDAPKHQLRQNFLLLHLVQLHYPMVNLLLLFSQLVPNLKVLK